MRPFEVQGWLARPHAQTLGGTIVREWVKWRWPCPVLERQFVPTTHGDQLSLIRSSSADAVAPRVLFLHGIAGSVDSAQVQTNMRFIQATYGWECWALNFRGSDLRYDIPRLYHAGCSDDLDCVVRYLRERSPAPLFVVGFSLGANVLLKWLGENGSAARPLIDAACALSVPFELSTAAHSLERTWVTRAYRRHFVKHLKARAQRMLANFPGALDRRVLEECVTLRDFDDKVTAPLHGFGDAENYYRLASSAGYLARIEVPCLIVHAQDDPFHPLNLQAAPQWLTATPNLVWELPRHGGHLGFLGRRADLWFESRVGHFLAAHG